MTDKETTFYVPVTRRPDMVRIDPELTLLANIKEVKSRDWWKEQLLSAATVAERIRAVEHFGLSKNNADRELLGGALNTDRFYGVQLEAATALGKSGGKISRNALLVGLDHQHPKVRRACVAALGKFVEQEQVIRALTDRVKKGDDSYFVEAALIDSLVKIQRKPAAEPLKAALQKDSHREVIRQAALRGLGKSPDSEALGILLEWTKRGHPRSCRTTAMKSLATYLTRNEVSSEKRTEVLETMTLYLNGEGPRVRRAAAEAIRDFSATGKPAIALLESLAEHDPSDRVRTAARAAVEKLKSDALPAQELTRLRKEIENIQKRNRELENRLLRLEQK